MSEHKHPHLSPTDQARYDALEPHQQRGYDSLVERQEKYDRNKKWLDAQSDYGWGLAIPTPIWDSVKATTNAFCISRKVSDEMTMIRFTSESCRDLFKQQIRDTEQ